MPTPVLWHLPCFKGGMNTGFFNAATQMATSSVLDMEVHTENLANANMPGYKRLETSYAAFASEMDKQMAAADQPAQQNIVVNHAQGALRHTGRNLDFGIQGEGYFVVSDGKQQFLTRNGNFKVDAEGNVINTLGMRLQTTSGDLQVPYGTGAAQLEMDDKLYFRVGKKSAGQLKVITVEDPSKLKQAGTTLFINNGQREIDSNANVMAGFLEQSNAQIFEEMVGIMTTMRNYEACQKMLRTVDTVEQKMMNKLN